MQTKYRYVKQILLCLKHNCLQNEFLSKNLKAICIDKTQILISLNALNGK